MSFELSPVTERNELFHMSNEEVHEEAVRRRRQKHLTGQVLNALVAMDMDRLKECLGVKEHIRYRPDFDAGTLTMEYQQPVETIEEQELEAIFAEIRAALLPNQISAVGSVAEKEAA